jgi:hypothetical protein
LRVSPSAIWMRNGFGFLPLIVSLSLPQVPKKAKIPVRNS